LKRRFFGIVAVFGAAISMMGSAGNAGASSAPRVDLSTDKAVSAYLTSIGVDPSTVVTQRGLNNYAGPSCPGVGWNCTTATSVVQIAAPGGQNLVQCGDPALFNVDPAAASLAHYVPAMSCFAAQDNVAGTNTMDIREQRPEKGNDATLACAGGTQQTTGGQNHFSCHQIIHHSGSELTQAGQETASIKQIAVGGGNHSTIDQEISLTSSVNAPSGAQHQNGWQSSFVDQEATLGAENHSGVHETQYLRGRISGAAESDQFQNTDPLPTGFTDCVPFSVGPVENPNSCANVNQQSDSGHQESQLNLLNDLDARTTATSGSQNLGGTTTGLDGTVPQPTAGATDTSREDYDERQDATAEGPNVDQNLTAPQSCCALQTGSDTNSLVNADQTSVQNASTSAAPLDPLALAMPNPNGNEATWLAGKIETNGNGTLTHKFVQDGGSDTRQCTAEPVEEGPPACALETVAVDGEPLTCGEGEAPAPNPEPPPTFLCAPID
jgi:hypothetical protein